MNKKLNNDFNDYDVSADTMIRGSSSSQSPSRQRARVTPFVWDRFVSRSTEEKPVCVVERPNVRIIECIIDDWTDDHDVIDQKDELIRLRNEFQHSWDERTISYEQKDFRSFRDADYIGVSKIGRGYSSSAFQRLKVKLFNTIFKRTHSYIDIKSSYPTMIVNAFRDLDIPAMKEYAESPGGIYAGFKTTYDIERDEVKAAVLSMICSYPSYAVNYGFDFAYPDKIRRFISSPFVDALKDDLTKIGNAFIERYGPFFRTMCNYRRVMHPDKGSGSDIGAALSWFVGDMEYMCMKVVLDEVGHDNIVWKYDGIVIPNSSIPRGNRRDFLSRMEDKVFGVTGIKLRFDFKDMHHGTLGITVPENELVETGYDLWKKRFEVNHFKVMNPPVFCRIGADGVIQDLDISKFHHVVSEHDKEFVKQWIADPRKRVYECKDFAPPPLVKKPNSYNLYRGLAASRLPPNMEEIDISLYMEHVRVLMGGEENSVKFMHDCIAYKIQNPGEKLRVMTFIRSTPGVGKDVWAAFLVKIFGEDNAIKVTKFSDVMDKNSGTREGKLMIFISEMNYEDNKKCMDEIKDAITEESFLVNRKYVVAYHSRSCNDFIGFSNNFNAISLPADDRRFHVVTASGNKANNAEYFEPLIIWMNQKQNQRAVYDYYLKRDVSGFNPSASRPITSSFMDVAEATISPFDIFIRKALPVWIGNAEWDTRTGGELIKLIGDGSTGILRIHNTRFGEDFIALCDENKWKDVGGDHGRKIWLKKMMKEAISRMSRFQSSENEPIIQDTRCGGQRYVTIRLTGINRYLNEMIANDMDVVDEEDEVEHTRDGMAIGFVPGRGN